MLSTSDYWYLHDLYVCVCVHVSSKKGCTLAFSCQGKGAAVLFSLSVSLGVWRPKQTTHSLRVSLRVEAKTSYTFAESLSACGDQNYAFREYLFACGDQNKLRFQGVSICVWRPKQNTHSLKVYLRVETKTNYTFREYLSACGGQNKLHFLGVSICVWRPELRF